MTRKDAERQLEYVRGLRIRLVGDRVLQGVAWKAAVLLGWPGAAGLGRRLAKRLGARAGSLRPPAQPVLERALDGGVDGV